MSREGKDIAANIYSFYKVVGELCTYERGEVAGCSYVWNRGGSWPSFMLGNPDPDSLSEALTAMGKGLAPPFWIMEKPAGDEARELDEAGVRAIREWSGMELRMDHFCPDQVQVGNEIFASENPSGERIRVLANEQEFSVQWMKIINENLLSGSQMGPEFLESISRSDQVRWVIAFLNDQPVGTGLSYSENGVCGLYMIATAASYRGRGIGTRVTAELIRQAMEAGDERFVLHATELGARIYKKLGFREVNSFSVLWNLGR